MANPPDNKNPGNNNPGTNTTGDKTPAQSGNRGTGGKPAVSTQPANSETPPPLPKTAATTSKPAQSGAATPASTPATPAKPVAAKPAVSEPAKPAKSEITQTRTTTQTRSADSPASPSTGKQQTTKPTAGAPARRPVSKSARPSRPLERERPRRPDSDRRPVARDPQRRPASGPGRRPEGRPARRPERGGRRPVYRDSRPPRRMAPPPGGKHGRFVAPAPRSKLSRRGYVVPPAAAAPAGSAWGPLLFGLLLLLGVLWYAIKQYAPSINADLTTRTNSALAEGGYGESANVEIDGRNAILKGNVATDADSESAEELVANTVGVRSVENELIVGATETAQSDGPRTQPNLTFFSTEKGVSLMGTVSDQAYADKIENTAKELYGEDNVTGSIKVDPSSTNPGWWPAVKELTPDLQSIEKGSFSVANGSLRLIGTAANEQVKNDIGAKAEEKVGGQLTVNNLIKVTAPAPAPEPEPVQLQPSFATYINSNSKITLFGSMPAESAALAEVGFAGTDNPVDSRITSSEEFEAPAWAANFGDSVEAMQDINKATVRVQPDGEVAISGIAMSEEAKQGAEASIAKIFTGQPVSNRIVVKAVEPAPEPEPVPAAPFMKPFATVTDNGSAVQIVGLLPPAASDALTAAYENAGRTVTSNVTADDRVMDPAWIDALSGSMQSMNGIENSKVTISSSDELTISGLAASEGDRQRAADTNLASFGNSVILRNDIRVKGPDIRELLARIDLAAIRFRSNSSELDADSIGILDQVADALLQVPDAEVAISGHTDSTGNNQRNLVLSAERADRVKNFLIDRGVSGGRMTSQGYGSSQPIASNETITGRALNRRIDFALTNGG